MSRAVVQKLVGLSILALVAGSAASCSKTVREGRSPAYLIVDRLQAAPGNEPDDLSDELSSDVQTHGGVYEDLGEVTFRLAMKDLGGPGNPSAPTQNNFITVNRYRVSFRRTDGRNAPGVDVPYPFEGAGTVTVGTSPAALGFVLVRAQSKWEPPLSPLRGLGGALMISTIADVTFYGRDQVGNDVTVSAAISVNFADWADPEN